MQSKQGLNDGPALLAAAHVMLHAGARRRGGVPFEYRHQEVSGRTFENDFARHAGRLKRRHRFRFTQCFAVGSSHGYAREYLIQGFPTVQLLLEVAQHFAQLGVAIGIGGHGLNGAGHNAAEEVFFSGGRQANQGLSGIGVTVIELKAVPGAALRAARLGASVIAGDLDIDGVLAYRRRLPARGAHPP